MNDDLFLRWYWRVRSHLLEGGMTWEASKRMTRERTFPLFEQQIRPSSAAEFLAYRPGVAA